MAHPNWWKLFHDPSISPPAHPSSYFMSGPERQCHEYSFVCYLKLGASRPMKQVGLEQDHTYTQTDDVTYPLDGQWRCVHTHGHRRWPVCVLLFFFVMVTFELKFEVGSEKKKKDKP